MKNISKTKLFIILILIALIFGSGVLYGKYLTFNKGSEYIASEMTRRNMDMSVFAPYINSSNNIAQTPDATQQETYVNINTATKEELEALDGISEKDAENIVIYRTKYGIFNSIEELLLVDGITETKLKKVQSQIEAI